MSGYLERVVESGTTSLRDVRGSIPAALNRHDLEEQHLVTAAPPGGEEIGSDQTPSLPGALAEPVLHSELDPPSVRVRHPAASLPQDITSGQLDVVSYSVPVMDLQQQGRPAADAASVDSGQLETRIEERRPHETAPALPPVAIVNGLHVPSLKDAGIRSVLSRDETLVPTTARRKRSETLDATATQIDRAAVEDTVNLQRATSRLDNTGAEPGERPSRHSTVPAARVEQWQRLKDRLLVEHYPTSKSTVPSARDDHNPSQPTVQISAGEGREIVIEQLEVVVAAPHPVVPPAAPGPRSVTQRSGAWSVAARRYLGKL